MGQRSSTGNRGVPARLAGGCLCVLALALLVPARAQAVRIEDSSASFVLELEVPDAEVCIAHPGRLRDEIACRGLDVEAYWQAAHRFDAKGAKGIMAGVVRYPEWGADVVVMRFDSGIHPWTPRDIDGYVRQFAAGVVAGRGLKSRVYGNEPGSLYSLLPIRGRQVIHFTIEVDVPEDHPLWPMSRMILFGFVSRGRVYMLLTYGPPDHGSEHAALAVRLAKSVRLPESKGDIILASRELHLALRLGLVIAPILLGALVWFLAVTSRGARRPRRPPPPT